MTCSEPNSDAMSPAVRPTLGVYLPIAGLILLSALAFAWPAERIGWDPFLDPHRAWSPFLKVIFAVAMFAIGTRLPRSEIDSMLRRWPRVLAGTCVQYTAMPLLAWCLALTLPVPAEVRVGIILTGCVPGAMASNVLTLQAKGNASYSVGLTTLATLVSPLVVPLLLMWLIPTVMTGDSVTAAIEKATSERFDPLATSLTLVWTVCLPVVSGHLLARFWRNSEPVFSRLSTPLAHMAILWIIAVVVGLNRAHLAWDGKLWAGLLLLNLGGYTTGWLAGKWIGLDSGMRRALMLEVGMQNAGLGSILATQIFPDQPQVALPTALFMVGCMLTGSILAGVLGQATRTGEADEATE